VPAWARRAVGEGVKSCPRAGCGRSACPVLGTDHPDLFPELHAKTIEEVLARATDLYERLQGNSSKKIG
jgi:hypothetical protein